MFLILALVLPFRAVASVPAARCWRPHCWSRSRRASRRRTRNNQSGRSEIVLTNLPPRESKAYKDLIGLAGKTAKGQILPLSNSEMWSMPSP